MFAAILTPTPDPFNQCIMALPMYFFYEVGIISAKFFGKKKKPEESAEEGQSASTPVRMKPATQTVGVASGGDDDYVSVPDSEPR